MRGTLSETLSINVKIKSILDAILVNYKLIFVHKLIQVYTIYYSKKNNRAAAIVHNTNNIMSQALQI